MAFTRGYAFETTELVTANKLHQLVENAVASFSSDDLGGTVLGVSSVVPSSPADGQVWFERETPQFTASTYTQTSELRYMLQTVFGAVALWDPWGLEINRPVANDDSVPATLPGQPVLFDTLDDPDGSGVTLAAYGQNSGGVVFLGLLGTARASVVASGTGARIVFNGIAPSRFRTGFINTPAHAWPEFMWAQGNGVADGPFWASSSASTQDGIFGIRLTDLNSDSERLPTYIWGAPVFHT